MTKTIDDLDNDIRGMGVMLEQVLDQNRAVLEAVGDMQPQVADLPKRDEFEELKQDMQIVKAAVTDTNREVHDLDTRVSRLEAAR
jgi:archaellum component FlaC